MIVNFLRSPLNIKDVFLLRFLVSKERNEGFSQISSELVRNGIPYSFTAVKCMVLRNGSIQCTGSFLAEQAKREHSFPIWVNYSEEEIVLHMCCHFESIVWKSEKQNYYINDRKLFL